MDFPARIWNSVSLFDAKHKALINASMLIFWLAAVLFLTFHHVMWRDEVRALNIALQGDNMIEMLQRLRGEGHPAIWYLLLRGAYDVFGRVEVLPAVSLLVAFVSVVLLIFRSPFPRLVVLALVFSHLMIFEYSIVARNYGISVLILLLIAELYPRWRNNGVVIGLLLLLLANTNVIGTLMTGAFLLFWFVDLLTEDGIPWTSKLGVFVVNAAIAAVGVLACALTILPTYNDAAVLDWSGTSPLLEAVKTILLPGRSSLGAMMGDFDIRPHRYIISAALFLSVVGLWPRRAAALAALFAIVASALFLALAAMGSERHAGVLFFFIVTLYWIAWKDVAAAMSSATVRPIFKVATGLGLVGFAFLLAVQTSMGVTKIGKSVANSELARSRSYDLAQLIQSRNDLANATVIASPDYMVEALPYYASNPTYLPREDRFGNVNIFSKTGKLDLDLGEILEIVRRIRVETGEPVLILLTRAMDELVPDQSYREGYNWTFQASAEQIQRFRNETTLLSQFDAVQTDEVYDVYLFE